MWEEKLSKNKKFQINVPTRTNDKLSKESFGETIKTLPGKESKRTKDARSDCYSARLEADGEVSDPKKFLGL